MYVSPIWNQVGDQEDKNGLNEKSSIFVLEVEKFSSSSFWHLWKLKDLGALEIPWE